MRVYELAKQLGMENRDLIPELKRLGISVVSHSSALEPDAVQKALEKLSGKQKGALKAPVRAGESEAGRVDRHKDADGASHPPGTKGAARQVPAEETKPDKRRILIKRKRTDEAASEEPAPLGVEPLTSHQPEQPLQPSTPRIPR